MSWGYSKRKRRAYPKTSSGRQGRVGGRGSSMSRIHRRRGQDRVPRITMSRGIEETGSSYRVRQVEPSEFQESSFRTVSIGSRGVEAVVGRPKGSESTKVQSYVFPKSEFKNESEVRSWIRENE